MRKPRKRLRHIAILRMDQASATKRVTVIYAWLRPRGVKPVAFIGTKYGDEFVVRTSFTSAEDAMALADEFAGEFDPKDE